MHYASLTLYLTTCQNHLLQNLHYYPIEYPLICLLIHVHTHTHIHNHSHMILSSRLLSLVFVNDSFMTHLCDVVYMPASVNFTLLSYGNSKSTTFDLARFKTCTGLRLPRSVYSLYRLLLQ